MFCAGSRTVCAAPLPYCLLPLLSPRALIPASSLLSPKALFHYTPAASVISGLGERARNITQRRLSDKAREHLTNEEALIQSSASRRLPMFISTVAGCVFERLPPPCRVTVSRARDTRAPHRIAPPLDPPQPLAPAPPTSLVRYRAPLIITDITHSTHSLSNMHATGLTSAHTLSPFSPSSEALSFSFSY